MNSIHEYRMTCRDYHCVKSVRIWIFLTQFLSIKREDLLNTFIYLFQVWVNTAKKTTKLWDFV